jgi:20S proteasome alpha/beta subunit
MTVAAGFRCQDGVVLCADEEYTEGGLLKFTGSKMVVYEGLRARVLLTFSGDKDFATMAMDKIVERLARSSETATEIRSIVEGEIQQLHKKHIYRHPGYKDGIAPEVSFLVGVWTEPQETDLWVTSRTTATRVPTWHTIGVGHYLAAYLGKTLFADSLNVREAALLGSYLLSQAKEHVPGCGGTSNIVTLAKDGSIKREDSLNIFEGEAYFSEFTTLVRRLFYAFGDLDLPNDELNRTVQIMIEDAVALRARRIKYREIVKRDKELDEKLRKRPTEP